MGGLVVVVAVLMEDALVIAMAVVADALVAALVALVFARFYGSSVLHYAA